MRSVLSLLALVLLTVGASAVELSGEARVRDGETIIVAGVPVGLHGLHCPQPGTKGGYSAALAIQKLTRNETVTCRLSGEREYDRLIGRCSVSDKDIGASLIAFGYCSRCPRFDPSGSYINAQRRAGHWKDVVPRYCR